jgi:arabinofuranosyltransferase
LLFKPKRKILYAGFGMVTYLLYIVVIGGDFMSGRFFSLPLLSASALLCRMNFNKSLSVATALVIVVVGLIVPKPTYLYDNGYSNTEIDESGISDERGFYYQDSGLLKMLASGKREPVSRWVEDGRQVRAQGAKIVLCIACGYFGYYAGPQVHIIDLLALNDPLLARLEIPDKDHWRIGHFKRALPAGYVESAARGINLVEDPEIKKLYSELTLITGGDIWSARRFKTILRMNLGLH